MPDDILINAISKRDAALAEYRRWDDFIRMYGELAGSAPKIEGRARTQRVAQPAAAGALSDTEQAAREIIGEAGRPVATRELLGLLEERGIEVGGKDPSSTLSARLSRAESLRNIRGQGWWIKGWSGDDKGDANASPDLLEVGPDQLDEPPAEGREAVPGGGT